MSGPDSSPTPPPEVPEEFAAAYQEAFEKALRDGEERVGAHQAGLEAADRVTEYRTASLAERLRDSTVFVPVIVVLLAVLLILAAFLLGKVFSHEVASTSGPADEASRTTAAPRTGATKPGETRPASKAWRGSVTPVKVAKASATCTLSPGRDAAGHKVSYRAGNAIDGKASTAWRCAGAATGVRLVLDLPKGTQVGQVGLVPGYAKTDPRNHADRYAENNRITRVRWTLAGGVVVEQNLSPAVGNRGLQLIRVPRTKSDRITLEILSVHEGPRNTTAVSEIRIGAARA